MRRTDPELLDRARQNRQLMNDAEALLWWSLRRNSMGVRFRRQRVVAGYLLDFACAPLKLDVESDGSQHGTPEDLLRDARLRALGWTVLRFWAWDVIRDHEMVLRTIFRKVEDLKLEQGQS